MAAEHEFETFVQDVVPAAYGAAMRDGAIDAFLRQGANEIGAALKAFPDAIQVDEPGAVFNPLYSDIAADKRAGLYGSGHTPSAGTDLPSPSAIAEGNAAAIYGESPQVEAELLSPSEIAEDPALSQPEPQHASLARGHRM
jgi:hypothetical protein